ncbi:MAG: alkaline phosphatase family protein, partial [Candidatus Omnitrophota bacterium]
WSNIDYSSRAFALDPARIYINLKGKYPRGSVDSRDKEQILKDLEYLFSCLEIDNKKVIRDIYRKEEIYSGVFLDRAPDLILVGNRGFNLKASIKTDRLADKGIFTGKHTQDDAFLLVRNGRFSETRIPKEPKVFNVVDILRGGHYA